MAPAAAWIAVRGSLSWSILLLTAAVTLWTAGFDILYACQDVDFDRRAGLYSIPKQWGIARALQVSSALHFLMAVLAQFMYVGAQVGTWSYFIQYVQEFTHQPEKIAGYFLTGTLGAFLVGRFSSAYLMRFVAPHKLLGAYAVVNVALVGFAVGFPGWAGLWAVFLTSFFMSLMFPTIFALGLKGLGPNTKIGGSLLVMAIVGGALMPLLMGRIADIRHSIAPAYLVPLIAYVVVAIYAFAGARPRPVTA